ncbi:hypothetical protein B7492_22685 [Bacillus mycoides]|uniref:Uncharacterized protein n=1 Tax=Bacillus mycoides TaxID=1405 RepID=A0A1W6ADR5_BACMY|nr:hypothetical protein [Bacillus mycoides]ARJ23831.1 hypothetical protein B7492_22685 [Bacillus mycoides]
MDLDEYQVLLPNKFWDLGNSKDELKQVIERYILNSYPGYWIEKVIQENVCYIAICTRGK